MQNKKFENDHTELMISNQNKWPLVKLKDECVFEYGKPLKKEERKIGSYPVFGSNGIIGYHNKYLTKGPCIIVGRKGTAGKVTYSQSNCFPIDTTFFIKLKNINRYNLKFLYFVIKTLRLEKMVTDSNVPGLNRNDAYRKLIPYPSLPEQEKIAGILSQIQKAIEIQDKLIKKTNELKQATMKQLFTYGVKGKKTKQTEIGEIPENWNLYPISEIGKVITGTTPKTSNKEYYGNQYKLISPVDLDSGQYVKTAHRMLTEKGLSQCKVLPKYSVLVGCIGNIGKIGMTLDEKSATNQQINSIICNKKSDSHFILYILYYLKKELQSKASQTTVPILNKTNFEKFKVPLPLLSEQKKVVDILMKIDQKIQIHKNKKLQLKELFKTMLNQLMTGKIRVHKLC